VEEYIAKSSVGFPNIEGIFDILTDAETEYKKVKGKNRNYILNQTTYPKLLKNKDKQVRKNAVLLYRKAILSHKESLANLLFYHFKSISTDAKLRNYKGSVHMLTYSDRVTDDILLKLFEKVSSLKTKISKYNKAHKKFYEAFYKEKYDPKYDFAREIINVKSEFSIEETKKYVKKAFEPFGDEYNKLIDKAINEK
ncbi:UNVERIFIED_CONTAM: hypothetical protein O8I53_12275, partial [Campylobacter lari]